MVSDIFQHCDIKNLLLDPENPRLPSEMERSQGKMLDFLARTTSIEELMGAIGENGFFEGEALIAVPAQDEGKFTVVEGNRRLAALRLLLEPDLIPDKKRIQNIASSVSYKPQTVPIALYENRGQVLNYLGNRHIAGVKPWGPLAKARYIEQLFGDTDSKADFHDRCGDVARRIGSRRDFIHKSLRALSVLTIIEEENFFEFEGLDENSIKFSLLTTALDYEGIRKYFLTDKSKPTVDRSIVNLEKLKNLVFWIFFKTGEGKRSKIGESRNLTKLSDILESPNACKAFIRGATIEQAYLLTEGVVADFEALCFQIQEGLREANALVADVSLSGQMIDTINSIFNQATRLKDAADNA